MRLAPGESGRPAHPIAPIGGGQVIQLPGPLYRLAEHVDGRREHVDGRREHVDGRHDHSHRADHADDHRAMTPAR
jgi:hypothetical protein